MRVLWGAAALILVTAVGGTAQSQRDPDALLQEAERLAWLKAWTQAAPLHAEAEQLFTARGDPRNALFARINHLRGQLPTLPIADVSQQLAAYLDDPLVQSDACLRLRILTIKDKRLKTSTPRSRRHRGERRWPSLSRSATRAGRTAAACGAERLEGRSTQCLTSI
jgi:hypothetical protein